MKVTPTVGILYRSHLGRRYVIDGPTDVPDELGRHLVDVGKATAVGSTPPSNVGNDPFDPSAHNVKEVRAYAAHHPDEVADIIAAEEAGKGRAGVLGLADD